MTIKMKDIARAAGVSMTAVSMVLNDKGNISMDTRKRVLQITRELGYVKSPSGGNVRFIGSFSKDLLSCFKMAFAEFGISLHNHPVKNLKELPSGFFDDTKVSGVLAHGGQWQPYELEKLGAQFPCVFLGSTIPNATVDTVWVDNVAAIQLATDYLIAHGHRNIGLVNGPDDSFPSAEKELGFRQALRYADPEIKGVSINSEGFGLKYGENAVLELLGNAPNITAFIAGELSLGLGIMNALHGHGLRVPDDKSIIVFRDSRQFDSAGPPLTAIGLPYKNIAQEAALHMVRRIQTPKALGKRLLLKPTLVERGSVSIRIDIVE